MKMHSEWDVSSAQEGERQNVFYFLDLSLEKKKFFLPQVELWI